MDARVNDFFNEVDEIAPLSESKNENLWEKCFDEESGYHYYWNTQTDKVTWDPPPGYRSGNESKSRNRKANNLYMPPRTAPMFPSTSGILPPNPNNVKIYKIGESAAVSSAVTPETSTKRPTLENDKKQLPRRSQKKPVASKPYKKNSDSEDERIILISSYGGESESEEESKKKTNDSIATSDDDDDDDEDYTDMLTKIQKRAKELKDIESKTVLLKPKPPPPKNQKSIFKNETKLTLVAGYSDSEEEEEEQQQQQQFENDSSFYIPPTSPSQEKVSHSTLFPAATAIDIKDFENMPQPTKPVESSSIDTKAFQRKKRIGVALINTRKKPSDKKEVVDNSERRGLGFSSENPGDTNAYSNFKSGGINFIKTDVLNPSQENEENEEGGSKEKHDGKVLKEIGEIYLTLKEKLGFLSEGKEPVSPVQAMLIQAEALHDALKSGDLKERYVLKWLNDNCKDLIKLEKEATPEGWALQWDRYHKRYYYQNATTGESQWEYPQPDVTRCDEAMDICTTPPRSSEPLSPPLPPHIGPELSPPPPPVISDFKPPTSRKRKHEKVKEKLPPLPSDKYGISSNEEPLPPGVDLPEPTQTKENADLSDELSSFYSDIAAFDTKLTPPSSSQETDADLATEKSLETVKKKKKDKVKLTQGIAMKKKGVSKLVEKWKNIQTQL